MFKGITWNSCLFPAKCCHQAARFACHATKESLETTLSSDMMAQFRGTCEVCWDGWIQWIENYQGTKWFKLWPFLGMVKTWLLKGRRWPPTSDLKCVFLVEIFLTDSIQKPPFGRICLELFPNIWSKSKKVVVSYPCHLSILFANKTERFTLTKLSVLRG